MNATSSTTVTGSATHQAPNVQELFKKLMEHKILPGQQKPQSDEVTTKPPPAPPVLADEPKIPDLTSLDSELLKQKYPAAIKSLYLGQQCATCGNRFPPQPNTTTNVRYARHLDWHFRQNKKEKLEANKARSRAWYYSLSDWTLYEELSDEKTPSPVQVPSQPSQSTAIGSADGIAEEDLIEKYLLNTVHRLKYNIVIPTYVFEVTRRAAQTQPYWTVYNNTLTQQAAMHLWLFYQVS